MNVIQQSPSLECLCVTRCSGLTKAGLLKATEASPPLKTLAFVENEDSFTKKDVLSLCSNVKHVEELTLSLADEEDVDFDALSYRCRLRYKRLNELHFWDTYKNILRLPGGVTAMRRYPNPLLEAYLYLDFEGSMLPFKDGWKGYRRPRGRGAQI